METPKEFLFDRTAVIALVTDVYISGFTDGRKTANQRLLGDNLLTDAFDKATRIADRIENE